MTRSPPSKPSTVAKKVPRPIVAPGPNPKGPPGWAEAQQVRIADQNEAVSQGLPPVAGLASSSSGGSIQDPATMQDQARAGLLPSSHSGHNGPATASTAAEANGQAGGPAQQPDALPQQPSHPPTPQQQQQQQQPQHPLATSTTAAGGQDVGDTSVASSIGGAPGSTDYGSAHSTPNLSNTASSSPKSAQNKTSPGRLSRTFHKLGEKLAIVPQRNSENLQNASTMPELP